MVDRATLSVTGAQLVGSEVRRTADGVATVVARTPWLTRRTTVSMTRTVGVTSKTFVSFVAGSLAKHLLDSMTTLATGKSSFNQPLFTATNFAGQQYTRNTECWVPLDLSGIAMSDDSLGRGCAVSPRHVILASHVGGQGATVHFVAANNAVVVRTITGLVGVSGDLSVGVLDSDLPASIKPLKVLPATFANYLPSVTSWPVPGFCIDGQKKVLAQEIAKLFDAAIIRTAQSSPFSSLTEPIVGGDSGNAALMVINNEPVLLGCFYTAAGNSASCPSICSNIAGVNAAMTTLGGGYQLTTVDLSGFNFYG